MINPKAYALGAQRSVIRELFEYGQSRAAQVGAENIFDYSLGNPSIPAPAQVNEAILEILQSVPSVQTHGYTSAIGELAMGEIFYEEMCRLLDEQGSVAGKNVVFYVPHGAVSRAVGQKRVNLERIYKKYSPLRIKVLEKNDLMRYNIIINII